MASVQVVSSSNKVISRVSYPHELSYRTNNSCYLFLYIWWYKRWFAIFICLQQSKFTCFGCRK